ncbi:MAG: hypothetical protein V4671_13855 [Armatimonadota bacterium]
MRTIYRKRTLAALSILLLLTQTTNACLNDRDSDLLAEEVETGPFPTTSAANPIADYRESDLPVPQSVGLPVPLSVITGRFPRHPALFYEMRIRRVAKELAVHPERLRLYDDVAVAYDRLGKDDEALFWIKKKHSRLLKTSPADPAFREDWYRYYANVGTFRAHQWIRAGADLKDTAQLRQARGEIAKAIHIKPDAHFGREKYQLAVMDWIIDHRDEPLTMHLPPHWAEPGTGISGTSGSEGRGVEGLSGLIVLGGAWESPDVFAALSSELIGIERMKLGYLAQLRCQELLDSGKKSLFAPELKDALFLVGTPYRPQKPAELSGKYRELRAEAETWQNNRWKYMLPRLHQGKHPDTDPKFWNEWKEPAPPNLAIKRPEMFGRFKSNNAVNVIFFLTLSAFTVIAFRKALRWMKM